MDVLAGRRVFAIDDAAWGEFVTVRDRPVSRKSLLATSGRAVALYRGVSGYSLPRPIAVASR